MKRIAALLAVLLLTACQPGQYQIPFLSTPTLARTAPPTGTPTRTPIPTRTAASGPSATPEPRLLRIWLPPLFDPNGSSPASVGLKARLTAYTVSHPDVRLDIRIKGSGEDAAILEALSLTRSAAPSLLPDLVAMPRNELEAAALKGVLHPLTGITEELDSPNWYPYARQLGQVQDVRYGLPFTGDALAIAYHPSQFERLPTRWEELFVAQKSLAFFGEDPNSLFLLALYLSTGSPVLDPSNRPYLDEKALTAVLQSIRGSRLIPLQSEQAAWTAFEDGRAQLALVWTSRFLQSDPLRDSALMPLPYPQGSTYSLATGWAWALAGADPQNDAVAADLAEYLVDDEFLATWDYSAGYLSPRPNALTLWDQHGMLELISQSAETVPGDDLLAALGPILQDAFVQVLNGNAPEAVAHSAAEALK